MNRIFIFIIFFTAFLTGNRASAQVFHPDYVDGEIYIKTYDTLPNLANYDNSLPALNLILNTFQVDSMWNSFSGNDTVFRKIYRCRYAKWSSADTLIDQLQLLPYIEYAEKIPIMKVSVIPSDYAPANQWYLDRIEATQAWDRQKGKSSIKIAVVDDAVRLNHEDLLANIWKNPGEIPNNGVDDDLNGYVDDVNGYDLADNDNNVNPPSKATNSLFTHGTHVAGIAAASTDNGKGIASISFNVSILPIKAAPDNGNGEQITRAYEGVQYATAMNADVINMSWGGNGTSITGQLVMNSARAKGIVLVAAAGNSNTNANNYPAAYEGVIAVGASDFLDKKANFSNFGGYVDVMAPGINIFSTKAGSNSSYGDLSGTSMAAPIVAGLSALILSHNASFSPAQVESFIKNGCENIDMLNPGFAGQLGAGRINAKNSLALMLSADKPKETLNTITIYPNPAGDFVFISAGNSENAVANLKITNLSGMIVKEIKTENLHSESKVDVSGMAAGFYIISVTDSLGNTGTAKLIKH